MPPSARPASSVIRFGIFELDLETGELRKSGRRVKLDHQPLQILELLLETRAAGHSGRAAAEALACRHLRRFRAGHQLGRQTSAAGPGRLR